MKNPGRHPLHLEIVGSVHRSGVVEISHPEMALHATRHIRKVFVKYVLLVHRSEVEGYSEVNV